MLQEHKVQGSSRQAISKPCRGSALSFCPAVLIRRPYARKAPLLAHSAAQQHLRKGPGHAAAQVVDKQLHRLALRVWHRVECRQGYLQEAARAWVGQGGRAEGAGARRWRQQAVRAFERHSAVNECQYLVESTRLAWSENGERNSPAAEASAQTRLAQGL